ncbi:MAG: hypothetical protein KJO20_07815, partial [Eudoraea sp.]|nr:hypothetical protein [Eudoraea sp.]
ISFYTVLYYVVRKSILIYRRKQEIAILVIPAVINYILIMGFSDIVVNISNVGIYFVLLLLMISTLLYRSDNFNIHP